MFSDRFTRSLKYFFSLLILLAVAACAPPQTEEIVQIFPTPTLFPLDEQSESSLDVDDLIQSINEEGPVLSATVEPVDLDAMIAEAEEAEQQRIVQQQQRDVEITVDPTQKQKPISEYIYGVANPPGIYIRTLQPSISSWTGEGTVRFNWRDGNSWNLGSLNAYRNTPVDPESEEDQLLTFIENAASAEATTYVVMPTLGWVARDNDPTTCSFTSEEGSCTTGNASTCQSNDVVANPNQTSLPSNEEDLVALVDYLKENEAAPKILGILHEPELWGVSHYDVHPRCTTYEEIATTYIRYASALKAAHPDMELAGPGTCCWIYYFNSGAGLDDKLANGNQDFIPWFLGQMKAYEDQNGERILDILDIHYYPEEISTSDEPTEARLRAPRSLWDPSYVDESWVREPVALIPRMMGYINDHYPETKLAISEWNFGADSTIMGGLAIADVLGVFGREGVYMAAYNTYPPFRSPGFWAFKMFTNYNNLGGKFGDISVMAESNEIDLVSAYASLDSETGNLHLIVINKVQGLDQKSMSIDIDNFDFKERVSIFQYVGNTLDVADGRIVSSTITQRSDRFEFTVPANSITHFVFQPADDNAQTN